MKIRRLGIVVGAVLLVCLFSLRARLLAVRVFDPDEFEHALFLCNRTRQSGLSGFFSNTTVLCRISLPPLFRRCSAIEKDCFFAIDFRVCC